MAGVKQMFLLIVFQGFYLGSVGQRWTFPPRMAALIGSCVEIPCTYTPEGTSETSGTVWYLYRYLSFDQEILNTKDSSSVTEKYRDRTSLVPGENSCTLRIDPVIRGDDGDIYYPGLANNRRINARDKHSKTVHLDVIDSSKNLDLSVPHTIRDGKATTLLCSAHHTCGSSPPSLQWNKPGQAKRRSVEISGGSWREESELAYIPSYVDDGHYVQCTATYPNGQIKEKSGRLNIIYAPRNVIVTIIGNDEVMEGSDVTLQCNSFSRPDVHEYEWYKGKTRLPDRGREMTVYNVPGDMEPYSCTAINRVGRGESAPTEIPLLYAPTGVHITVNNGSELVCDFLSSRPDVTHYTWMKDGSVLYETGKTLTLEDNEESSGQYSCIAHNRVGISTSEEIHIKRTSVNLPLILGTAAGIFFLILFILVISYCLR
ncbi:B-cell receptor CD22-like [Leptodactylus fuscus]